MKHIFLFLLLLSPNFLTISIAQNLSPDDTDQVLQLLKTERNLIIKNQQISKEKKASLLVDFGLLHIAEELLVEPVESYEYFLALAKLQFKKHQYNKSLHYLEKALQIKPEEREALLLKAEIFIKKEDFDKAISVANERLAQVSFDDKAIVLLAKSAYKQLKLEKAKGHIQEALSNNPNNADAWYLKALVEHKTNNGSYKNALEKALQLNPYHSESRFLYGLNFSNNNIIAKESHWEIAIHTDPFNTSILETWIKVAISEKDFIEIDTNVIAIFNSLNASEKDLNNAIRNRNEEDINILKTSFKLRNAFFNNQTIKFFTKDYISLFNKYSGNPILFAAALEFCSINELFDNESNQNLASIINDTEIPLILNIKNSFNIENNKVLLKIITKALGDNLPVASLYNFGDISLTTCILSTNIDEIPFYEITNASNGKNEELKARLISKLFKESFPEDFKLRFRQIANNCFENISETQNAYFYKNYLNFLKQVKIKSNTQICGELNQYFEKIDNIIFSGEPEEFQLFQVEALVQNASKKIKYNNFNEADQLLNQALKIKNNYTPVYLTRTNLCLKQGKFEEAEVWLASAEQQDINNPRVYETKALFAIEKFKHGRSSANKSLELASVEYSKALQLETDSYLFGKLNTEVQELYKIFAKPYESLRLAETYLSTKANNSTNSFDVEYINYTSANAMALRTINGYGTESIPRVEAILKSAKNNSSIQDLIWLSYSEFNEELLDSLNFTNNSLEVQFLNCIIKSEKIELSDKVKTHFSNFTPTQVNDELIYLKYIELLIDSENVNEASELMSRYSFSKYPEVWAKYNFVRGKLLLANKETQDAINALLTSLEISPYTHKSRILLLDIMEKADKKNLKKLIKRTKKEIRKLDFAPGPDIKFL